MELIVIILMIVILLAAAYAFYSHRRRSRQAKAMSYLSEVDPVAGYLGAPRDSVSHAKGPRARISDAPQPSEMADDTGTAAAAAMPPPPRRPGFLSQLKAFFFRRGGARSAVWRQFEDGSTGGSADGSAVGKSDLPVGDQTVVHSDLESPAKSDLPLSPEPLPTYSTAIVGSGKSSSSGSGRLKHALPAEGASASPSSDGIMPSVPQRWRRASAMQRALESEADSNARRSRKPARGKGLLGQDSAIAEDDDDEPISVRSDKSVKSAKSSKAADGYVTRL